MKRLDRILAFLGEFCESLLWGAEQQWLVRWMIGGHWVYMDDEWISVEVFRIDDDGLRFFSYDDPEGGTHMIHETYIGIEDREYH
jgi:hypothetical protein